MVGFLGGVAVVPEKSFPDLLNAYRAIEVLLSSRVLSYDTRRKALQSLKALNDHFAELLGRDEQKQNQEHKTQAAP
jgi:hypothetical protein